MKKILTLCIIQDDDRVLLGMKKRGFGAGRWNGFGGKVEEGESPFDAVLREVREETGLTLRNCVQQGVLIFIYAHKNETMEVHVFGATAFEGEPQETEEMRSQWFDKTELPYAHMWPDDTYWLPAFLDGKQFEGRFHFKDYNTIIEHDMKVHVPETANALPASFTNSIELVNDSLSV